MKSWSQPTGRPGPGRLGRHGNQGRRPVGRTKIGGFSKAPNNILHKCAYILAIIETPQNARKDFLMFSDIQQLLHVVEPK